MERSPDRKSKASATELTGAWNFLPYEEERESPRREIQLQRLAHALVIPFVDAIILSIAFVVSYLIAESLVNEGTLEGILGTGLGTMSPRLLWTALATLPLWLLVFSFFGVYRREITRLAVSTFDELPQTIGAVAVGSWVTFSILALTSQGNPSGRAIWAFVALAWFGLMIMIPMGRAAVRISLSFSNPFSNSTLVVGAGSVGRSLIGRLKRHNEYGLRVVGFLDTALMEEDRDEDKGGSVQLLGRPSELKAIVDRYGISRVIIAFSKAPHPFILEVIHQCQEMKVDVTIVPRLFEALSPRAEIEDIEGLPVLSLPRYARHGWFMRGSKRLMDLFGASLAVILLSPVLLLTAIGIKLDSPGPVFFTQERMGKNHKRFRMYKFRSMYEGAAADRKNKELVGRNEASGPMFKMKDDPRITRVGRLIRRLSIDELPQLINVFRGEMSLVGPRPLWVEEAEACSGTADMRHLVQPGITGLWQVLGRSNIPFEEMVQLDYLYVTNWTIKWDIKIILRTFIAILRKRGAY